MEALEHLYNGKPCPECGFEAGEAFADYEVVWEDDADVSPEDDGPKYCPGCGRQLVFTVVWADLPLS